MGWAGPVVAAPAARGAGLQALLDELPHDGWSRRGADNHTFVVRHYWGEVSYLVLSFVSKGLLGGTLLSSVVAFDSLEAALADARNATA